ncbi:hypothetical protein BG006_005581 [Podila minutissima]|uniref:Uncharacterized protein n=1 Tax=Podila minutissima TaxID=64525 RepID=A0A9P5SJS7_9FUNG|nr:hypothetical protein BG006_005581 [Podila minutissima]
MLAPLAISASGLVSPAHAKPQDQDPKSTSVSQSRYESLSNIQAPPSQQEHASKSSSKSRIPVKNSSIPRRVNSSLIRNTISMNRDPGPSTVPTIPKMRREGSGHSLIEERGADAEEPSETKATAEAMKEPRRISPPPQANQSRIDDKDKDEVPKSSEVSHRNNVSFAKSSSSKHSRRSHLNSSMDRSKEEPEGDTSLTRHTGSFRAVYAYPNNTNVVTYTATDPKTAMTTTMTLLDTRPVTDSRSILSQTRRVADQKLRQHQLDIQRDLFSSLSSSSSPRDMDESISKSTHGADKSLRKDNEKSFAKALKNEHSRTSSSRQGRSESPTSPSSSLSHRRSNRNISPNKSREIGPRRQLQRVMSSQIFIPNPRGIAPTPSPDQSAELVRRPSFEGDRSLVRLKQSAAQENMRLYEEQLDHRIRTVQENNRRLLELKFLLEKQRERERVLAIEYAQAEDGLSDEERERTKVEVERERERLEWEETKVLLEQSQIVQQQQKDDLERERGTRRELELSVKQKSSQLQELELKTNQMSSQVQELLELGETQAQEIEQIQAKAAQEHDQWEEQRQGLEERNQHHESRWDKFVADAEKRIQSEKTQTKDIAAAVDFLKGYNQELKDRLQQQESKSEADLSRQTEQTERYKSKVRDLERQLAMEKEFQSEDQEAQTRVMARFDALLLEVKQKDDRIEGLENQLERRQGQLDETLELVETLEDQLQDVRANMHDNQQQKEQHRKILKQHQSELREIGKELTLEQESSRKHQKHIEILLETQQESSQLHETKIRQLQEELDRCTQQLSMSAASSSTSSSAIHQLQVQIQDQEHILLEKEDRIQELEQELRQAQQQAQSVVADLEQDLQELEHERVKISNQLQKTHLQVEAEKTKVKELEDQLHREQGMALELDRQQEKELVMLESLLADLESEGGPTTDLDLLEGHAGDLFGQLRNKIGDLVHERGELLDQRAYQDQTLAEQRQQLERCESEIEAQQDQLMRSEHDRKAIEEQMHHLQDDLDLARHQQHQLREQVRSRDTLLKEHANSMSKSQFGSSQHQHRQQQQNSPQNGFKDSNLRQQISTLEQRVMLLEEEKQQALGQLDLSQARIKKMGEKIQDQTEAARSIREKYLSKIAELKMAVVEYRDTVVKQEGQMFLYLSVIERLKLQMKGGTMMPQVPVGEDVNETVSNETDASDTASESESV